ncbi:MAG: hypothetical protein LC803_09695 [Acidobacteria bacterium]|nr:hypothetical protein [Acidobacteriota bacterium]
MNNPKFAVRSPSLRNSIIALLLLLMCVPAHAQEETRTVKPAFAFGQTETLALEWEQKSEQRVEIVSKDGKEHALKILLSNFALKDAGGNAILSNEVIKLAPDAGKVSAEASLIVLIQVARNLKVKPGSYSGTLLAVGDDESSKGLVERLQVKLVVPDVQPLVKKLTITTYRMFPLWSGWWWCPDCCLPVREAVATERTWLRKDVPLGGLKRDQGGSASVWWSGQMSVLQGEAPKLELEIRDLKHAGKYEGSVQVNPLDNGETGKVELVVNASDLIVWPIIVLILSILLTLLAKRYIGVNRTILTLREQEAALGVAFQESQRRFTEAALGESYAPYSIEASLAEERRKIVERIRALQRSSSVNIEANNSDYIVILESLKRLQAQVNAWGHFAEELQALRNLLDARKDDGAPPPGIENVTPALLSDYGRLLQGTTLNLTQFEASRKKLIAALVAIPVWFEIKDSISRDRELIQKITSNKNLSDEQKTLWRQAQDQIATAWDKLWRASGIEDLALLKAPDGSLESAHQILIQLFSQLEAAKAPTDSLAFVMNDWFGGEAAGDSDSYQAMKEMLRAPADDAARQEFYVATRHRWDRALTLIALITALLTGLHTNYFGQPFGTLKDYVGLFLWGVGTKVIVDTASTALQWIFSGGLAERLLARTR